MLVPTGKPLPGRLARNAESRTNHSPTHLTRPQKIDGLPKLIAFALHRLLDGPKPFQQPLRWQFLDRRGFRAWKMTGDDLIAQRDALVADENATGAGNQLPHLVL